MIFHIRIIRKIARFLVTLVSMPDALPLSELDLDLGAEDAVGRLSRHHGVGQVQLETVLGPCT